MSTAEAWGETGQKYTIHDDTFEYFRILESRGSRPFTEMTPQEARADGVNRCELFVGDVQFDGKITEFVVPAPKVKEGITISVYNPSKCPPTAPVLVYFHGGGFVLGSRQQADPICRSVARDTPCIVVNVEYRLAPEFKLPVCLDDAVCVTRWVKMNRALIGASNVSILGAGGDSVGGHIAATVCHEVPGLDFQVLIYPMVDMKCSHPSIEEFSKTPGLNQKLIDWFTNLSVTSPDQLADPRVTPLLRQGFAGLPPALVILAELDPLRDCGYAYRDRLSESGVETKLELIHGVPHGCFRLPGHFKKACGKAYAAISEFIRKHGQQDGRLLLNDD